LEYGLLATRQSIVLAFAAAATAFIAFALSFPNTITMALFASLASFLAAFLSLIAFAIDLALYAYVRSTMVKLGTPVTTTPGRGPCASRFPRLH
jgi:hypothetical protein